MPVSDALGCLRWLQRTGGYDPVAGWCNLGTSCLSGAPGGQFRPQSSTVEACVYVGGWMARLGVYLSAAYKSWDWTKFMSSVGGLEGVSPPSRYLASCLADPWCCMWWWSTGWLWGTVASSTISSLSSTPQKHQGWITWGRHCTPNQGGMAGSWGTWAGTQWSGQEVSRVCQAPLLTLQKCLLMHRSTSESRLAALCWQWDRERTERLQTTLMIFRVGRKACFPCLAHFWWKRVVWFKIQFREILILTQISCLIPLCMYEN